MQAASKTEAPILQEQTPAIWSLRGAGVLIGLLLISLWLRMTYFVGCIGSDDMSAWYCSLQIAQGNFQADQILTNPIASSRFGLFLPTASFFKIFGSSEFVACLYPLTMSLIGAIAIWDICRRLCQKLWPAHIAVVFIILNSLDIQYSSILLPDGPMNAWSTIAIWFACLAYQKSQVTPQIGRSLPLLLMAAAGACAAIACAHKIVAVQIAVGLGLWTLCLLRKKTTRSFVFALVAGFALLFAFEHGVIYYYTDNALHRWEKITHGNEENHQRRQAISGNLSNVPAKLTNWSERIVREQPAAALTVLLSLAVLLAALGVSRGRPLILLFFLVGITALAMRALEMTQTYSYQPRRLLPFLPIGIMLLCYYLSRYLPRPIALFLAFVLLGTQGALFLAIDGPHLQSQHNKIAATRWLASWIEERPEEVKQRSLYTDLRTYKLLYTLSGFQNLQQKGIYLNAEPEPKEIARVGEALFKGARQQAYQENALYFENGRTYPWMRRANWHESHFEYLAMGPMNWKPLAVFQNPNSPSLNSCIYEVSLAQEPAGNEQLLEFLPVDSDPLDSYRWGWSFMPEAGAYFSQYIAKPEPGLLLQTQSNELLRLISGEGSLSKAATKGQLLCEAGKDLLVKVKLRLKMGPTQIAPLKLKIYVLGYDAKGRKHKMSSRQIEMYYPEQCVRLPIRGHAEISSLRLLIEIRQVMDIEIGPVQIEYSRQQ